MTRLADYTTRPDTHAEECRQACQGQEPVDLSDYRARMKQPAPLADLRDRMHRDEPWTFSDYAWGAFWIVTFFGTIWLCFKLGRTDFSDFH